MKLFYLADICDELDGETGDLRRLELANVLVDVNVKGEARKHKWSLGPDRPVFRKN